MYSKHGSQIFLLSVSIAKYVSQLPGGEGMPYQKGLSLPLIAHMVLHMGKTEQSAAV